MKLWKFSLLLLVVAGLAMMPPKTKEAAGAWQRQQGDTTWVLLLKDGYAMVSQYSLAQKKFYHTYGGAASVQGKNLTLKLQFDSKDKTQVGKQQVIAFKKQGNTLKTNLGGTLTHWQKIDDARANLSGNWRITQIERNGAMESIPIRARRTLKLLTDDRFQWAAINIETGEFFGTGGGHYTFANQVYTETIEFFSRDASRVGMQLQFADTLRGNDWIHTGKSSKGEPLYEIWSRFADK